MNGQYQLTPEILMKAIKDEQDAIMYYKLLITLTSDNQDVEFIRGIHNDEVKHFSNFYHLYKQLTGMVPQIPLPKQPQISSFVEGIKKAFLDELYAYEYYRDIYIDNNSPDIRSILFDALTDENEHAMKLNFMLTKTLENRD